MLKHVLLAYVFMLLQYTPNLFSNEYAQNDRIPADVSFLTIDLKYHPERGAQICEIQHGVPSRFGGDAYLNGDNSIVAQNMLQELNRFYDHSWIDLRAFSEPALKKEFLSDEKWINVNGFIRLKINKLFLECAAQPVIDPTDLDSYHGFAFMDPKATDDRERFIKKYPGVLLIDNAIYKLRRDKFKMSELLIGHEITEKHKPKWGLYNRKEEFGLAERIINDIGSDLLVIKPLDGWRGRGIIILKKEDLNETLEYFFKRKPAYLPSTDPEHEYWLLSDSEYFIVEEFIDVLPIALPHLDGKLYSPTMRLAFLLYYNKQKIDIICLGGYNYFPKRPITDSCSLTEKYKTACGPPYYSKCDPEIFNSAAEQLKEVLSIIYRKLLGLDT